MLSGAEYVGFIPITDVARARDFYTGFLGLRVLEESPAALVLDANGTMLRLTPIHGHQPRPGTIAGWAVQDMKAAINELTAAGVQFNRYDGMEQDIDGVWISPSGAQVAWFDDPDGNTLSLTTFPKA